MSSKIITPKEFNRIYFTTGKDPDGNKMPEIILGGEDDSYNRYLLNQQATHQVKLSPLIPIATLEPLLGPPTTPAPTPAPLCPNPNPQPPQTEKLYIWRSMDDDKVRPEHANRDDKTFNWNGGDIRPGEDYGCRCYAEFLDANGNPNGEYGRIAWPDTKTESNPQPYYEPSDKNGKPLHDKNWEELTPTEKELRKQEELEKFKNSDRLRKNIQEAERMKNTIFVKKYWWFYKQVKSGGPWDYKKNGHPEMEHVGNFNYGVTGTAIGFSKEILGRAAGWQQGHGGAYDPQNGHYWGTKPYGDDPIDQHYIDEGIDWYNCHY